MADIIWQTRFIKFFQFGSKLVLGGFLGRSYNFLVIFEKINMVDLKYQFSPIWLKTCTKNYKKKQLAVVTLISRSHTFSLSTSNE